MLRTVILVAAFVALALASKKCEMRKGKKMLTFSKTREFVKIGCRLNMIRNTECGDWKVTVSPGMELRQQLKDNGKFQQYVYVLNSVYMGFTKKDDDTKKLFVTMDNKTIKAYFDAAQDSTVSPLTKLPESTLEIADTLTVSKQTDARLVVVKDGTADKGFKVSFEMYDPTATATTSQILFWCDVGEDGNFKPNNFPTQLCGGNVENEAKLAKKENDDVDTKIGIMSHAVFSSIVYQTDPNCKAIMDKTQSTECAPYQYLAHDKCIKIAHDPKFTKCLAADHMDPGLPMAVMKLCIDWGCTNFTSTDSCDTFKKSLTSNGCDTTLLDFLTC